MPTTTKKLKLFKYNPETDGKQTFNIKTALNDNFDKIDAFADDVENKLPTFITTAKTLEKLAVQNMYTTGTVSTDTQGYNQLLAMKHSTFDKSKFTVVGNPTITNDGMASGFSRENYLVINKGASFDITKPHKICFNYKVDSYVPNTYRRIIKFNSENYVINAESITTEGYKIRLEFLFSAERVKILTPVLNYGVSYDFYYEWDGTKYSLYYKQANDTNYIKAGEQKSTSTLTPNAIQLYTNYEKGTDSTDLSQFSFTVDGKEVLSGNKTGIDTIKADNYEVVGSPVISDDGVASDISGSNYLTFPLSLNPQKTLEVSIEGVWGDTQVGIGAGELLKLTDNTNRLDIYRNRDSAVSGQIGTSDSDYQWLPGSPTTTVGAKYKISYLIDTVNNTARLQYYENGVFIAGSTKTLLNLANMNWANVSIGKIGSTYNALNGSIDLNSFKIYVDGNLVYQPCLKIPYTQSKTGSKIVDVAYRDRVQDLYEQTGIASYYTIDETNQDFTLPMGEIYGMIEQAKSSADGKVSKSGDTMTGQLHVNDQCQINHVPKISDSDNTATPLVLYQKKASDFGANTYSNILFKNVDGEDVGVIGGVEKTDGSHYLRLVTKNNNAWFEMPQICATYRNGFSWYRRYADGFIEQGFFISPVYWADNEVKNFALVTPFSSTEYTVNATPTERGVTGGNSWGDIAVNSIATTSINIKNGIHTTTGVRVYACGY